MNMKMTFDEFKQKLLDKFGAGKVRFREVGANGWTSVDDVLAGRKGGNDGPHWCDACPIPATGRMLGTYDFNSEMAEFFVEVS